MSGLIGVGGGNKFSSRAGRVLFDAMQAYMNKRWPEMMKSRVTLEEVIGVLMSSLAGVCALGIRWGMMSRADIATGVPAKFLEMLDRDLRDSAGPAS